jgi:N-glycosyltransferase
MRILITTMPAGGHLRPLAAVGQVAARLGHSVVVCAPDTAKARVEAYGLRHLPAGHDGIADHLAEDARADRLPDDHPERVRRELLTEGYPGAGALRTARDVIAHAETWRPDVIVRGTCEFGGYLAAEALGLPHASVGTGGGNARYLDRSLLAPALDTGRAVLGLAPDPRAERIYAHLHANLAPAAYDPDELTIPNARCYRHASPEASGERLDDPGEVTVLAAFGTMNPLMRAWDPVTRAVVDGLGELGRPAVVAAGPGRFGAPPNVRVVEYVPQPLLLECCQLFVNHGGFNSVREALRLGVPMVIVPWMTDSHLNADRCVRAGLARVVPRDALTPTVLRDACVDVLGDPRYRDAARAMRRRMLALPPLDVFIQDLEALS